MLHSAQWKAVGAPLVALAAMFTLACGDAAAQERAFRVSGAGVGPAGLPLPGQAPRPHWIVGQATHLGRHYGEGAVRTDSAVIDLENRRITGEFGGGAPFVFIAANEDRLVTWYGRTDHGASRPGVFELTILGMQGDGSLIVQAIWIAEFVVVPDESTGRFAGVTGSWVMVAWSLPFVLGSDDPVYYAWEGEGRLTFPRP